MGEIRVWLVHRAAQENEINLILNLINNSQKYDVHNLD